MITLLLCKTSIFEDIANISTELCISVVSPSIKGYVGQFLRQAKSELPIVKISLLLNFRPIMKVLTIEDWPAHYNDTLSLSSAGLMYSIAVIGAGLMAGEHLKCWADIRNECQLL